MHHGKPSSSRQHRTTPPTDTLGSTSAPKPGDSEPLPRPEPGSATAGDTMSAFSPARLRAWRHARGIDHASLASAAKINVDTVAACEDGHTSPTPDMIAAWSALLDCQPDQLHSYTPDAPAEYWKAANQAMPPMSKEDLAVVARIFARRRSAG